MREGEGVGRARLADGKTKHSLAGVYGGGDTWSLGGGGSRPGAQRCIQAPDHLWMWVPVHGPHPVSRRTCNRTRQLRKAIRFQLLLGVTVPDCVPGPVLDARVNAVMKNLSQSSSSHILLPTVESINPLINTSRF